MTDNETLERERDEAIEVAKYWQRVAEECERAFGAVRQGRDAARADSGALVAIITDGLAREAQNYVDNLKTTDTPQGDFYDRWQVEDAFIAGQASRKPEAAPSDTDRDYLLLLVRQTLSANRHEARPTVARAIVRELIAEGFSRTSQPVQVEVTEEVIERAAKVLYADYAREYAIAPWSLAVRGPFMSLARAALSAALGGTDDPADWERGMGMQRADGTWVVSGGTGTDGFDTPVRRRKAGPWAAALGGGDQ